MFYLEAKEKINEQLEPWHDFNLKVLPLLSWPLFVMCYTILGLDGVLLKSGLSCLVVLAYAHSNSQTFLKP